MHNTATFLGYKFFSNRKSELLKKINHHLKNENDCLSIFTPNAEQLVQAWENPNLNRHLKQADLLIADGMSLVWSSKLLSLFNRSQAIEQRISGIELAQDLLKIGQSLDLKILLIGGRDYQLLVDAQETSQVSNDQLWQLRKGLSWTLGYKEVSQQLDREEQLLKNQLLQLKPDIVLLAFGAPFQEEWLISHLDLLNQAQVKLAMTTGGAFDIILGRLKRAPVILQKMGLEWLFRLIQEPWRWKRQTRLIKFGCLVIKQLF